MNTLLITMFYLIPAIICWISIYYYAKSIDKGDKLGETIFAILLICSILPVFNLLYAFIVSLIFILRKSK